MMYQAGKAWRAAHWSKSANPTNWLWAAELEPGNGEYWYRLGAFRQSDFEQADLPLAIQYYQLALERNPRSSLYWTSLASAYEMTGAVSRAREAFEKARSAYPISAEVTWNYGNFLLRQSEPSAGFAEIHSAIVTDPTLTALAITRCWKSDPNVNRLLNDVLPANLDAYFQALDFLSSAQEIDSALVVWDRLLALGKPFPIKRAFPFLDVLIGVGRTDDAQRAWRKALVAAGQPQEEPAGDSLVWNGNFEHDLVNGGFDWRKETAPGMTMVFDTKTVHSGARSLRVDFNGGSNIDFQHLYQLVPVEPNHSYHFHAYLRTEGITTESGMRFWLSDPNHRELGPVTTPDLTGTQPWTPVELDLTTGPDTRVLKIVLRRVPSRLFENRLGGTVWVDNVTLVPAKQTGQTSP